jgi:hypothetical protein
VPLLELIPGLRSVAEICCGDCLCQHQIYTRELGLQTFHGLDLEPTIVAANCVRGIDFAQGDALDPEVIRPFAADNVIFFGPSLSEDCGGHRLLGFGEVTPSYEAFDRLLLGELNYAGLLVYICLNSTTLGCRTRLYRQIRMYRPHINTRLIHHSYSMIAVSGEVTELRLKYARRCFPVR